MCKENQHKFMVKNEEFFCLFIIEMIESQK